MFVSVIFSEGLEERVSEGIFVKVVDVFFFNFEGRDVG